MRAHGLGGFWLMDPTSNRLMEDAIFPQVIFEDPADGPYNDSAIHYYDEIEGYYDDVRVVGPYLGIWIAAPDDEYADVREGRLRAEQLLDSIGSAPRLVGLKISAWEVADDSDIPAGILDGRPTDVDLAELQALASNTALKSRISMGMQSQRTDVLDIRLSTHVRDYDTVSATGAIEHDPEIATLVTGRQVRWTARDAGNGRVSIELRSGITIGGDEFEKIRVGVGTDGMVVERSDSALTQARFSDELAVGERMATVSPGAGVKGQLIVIVVERLK
jgi:hypothetical protein